MALLVKRNIVFSPLEVPGDVEAVWIKTKLNNRTVFVGGVYRAPNSPVEHILQLRQFMETYMKEQDSILLLGDFNLPATDWH